MEYWVLYVLYEEKQEIKIRFPNFQNLGDITNLHLLISQCNKNEFWE